MGIMSHNNVRETPNSEGMPGVLDGGPNGPLVSPARDEESSVPSTKDGASQNQLAFEHQPGNLERHPDQNSTKGSLRLKIPETKPVNFQLASSVDNEKNSLALSKDHGQGGCGTGGAEKQLLQSFRFTVLNKIGQGGYGDVYTVCKTSNDTTFSSSPDSIRAAGHSLGLGNHGLSCSHNVYALKVVAKRRLSRRPKFVEYAQTERQIMASMDHPFLVKLKYAFQSPTDLFYVMEYVPGGEVLTQLSSMGSFSEEMARFYVAEVILALEHLHDHSIVYRDLKPDNILIQTDGHIKLADFGLCKILQQHSPSQSAQHLSPLFSTSSALSGMKVSNSSPSYEANLDSYVLPDKSGSSFSWNGAVSVSNACIKGRNYMGNDSDIDIFNKERGPLQSAGFEPSAITGNEHCIPPSFSSSSLLRFIGGGGNCNESEAVVSPKPSLSMSSSVPCFLTSVHNSSSYAASMCWGTPATSSPFGATLNSAIDSSLSPATECKDRGCTTTK